VIFVVYINKQYRKLRMKNTPFTDPLYLRTQQYGTASNLNARIELHKRFSANPQGWMPWLFEHLDLPPQAKVLEAGCGTGSLWRESAHKVPAGWEVILTDLSFGMANEARRNLSGLLPANNIIGYAQCDAQHLPFPSAFFDAIIANFMLQHVPNRMQGLREFKRLLKPDGCLHLSTNGKDHLCELNSLVARYDPNLSGFWEENPFTIERGEAELRQVFPNVRLERYIDSLEVTEARPLAAYIHSLIRLSTRDLGDPDRLEHFLEGELQRDGVIHITKSPGLFICSG
jgi:ubiquinone/menaquinone biosynthesis C-methylase UbiE